MRLSKPAIPFAAPYGSFQSEYPGTPRPGEIKQSGMGITEIVFLGFLALPCLVTEGPGWLAENLQIESRSQNCRELNVSLDTTDARD
jgi:hypothetical protein